MNTELIKKIGLWIPEGDIVQNPQFYEYSGEIRNIPSVSNAAEFLYKNLGLLSTIDSSKRFFGDISKMLFGRNYELENFDFEPDSLTNYLLAYQFEPNRRGIFLTNGFSLERNRIHSAGFRLIENLPGRDSSSIAEYDRRAA